MPHSEWVFIPWRLSSVIVSLYSTITTNLQQHSTIARRYIYPVPFTYDFPYNVIPTVKWPCPLEAGSRSSFYLHPRLSSTSPLALVSFSLSSILRLVKMPSHWPWTPLTIPSLPRNTRRFFSFRSRIFSFRSSRSLRSLRSLPLSSSNQLQPLPCPNT
jgi:hypothetical protein